MKFTQDAYETLDIECTSKSLKVMETVTLPMITRLSKHDGKHALSRLIEFLVIKTSAGHIKSDKIIFPGIKDRGKLYFCII